MSKSRLLWLVPAMVLGLQSACSQGVPASGLYQIVSGRYVSCCGIFGPLVQLLPKTNNAFVELTVDVQKNLAQMRILGQDMRTVLRIPGLSPRKEFVYAFTNGMIFPDHVRFGGLFPPPLPDEPSYSFVISNLLETLSVNGTVMVPCEGCADVPQNFQHTNVLAVAMPKASIRVSEVEVCWNTATNLAYQVQYRSGLTSNAWVDLGDPIQGNGATNCIADKVPWGEPERYYRVLTLP